MKRSLLLKVLVLMSLLQACNTGPQPISYGTDGCHFCKMTIVDKKFGAEMVTDKGKIYKFDAIECLLNYTIKESGFDNKGFSFWVTDINRPGTFVDATQSYFLRTSKLPSPMGMYLSSYLDYSQALLMQEKLGGNLYSWEELISSFSTLPDLTLSQ